MRSLIQRRLGGTEYTARVHGTSRSELRSVYAVQPGPRSYGLIDNVKSACTQLSRAELDWLVGMSHARLPGSNESEPQWEKSRSVRDYFELLTIPEIPARKKIERNQPKLKGQTGLTTHCIGFAEHPTFERRLLRSVSERRICNCIGDLLSITYLKQQIL